MPIENMAFKQVNNLYIGSFKDGNNKDNGTRLSDLDFDFEIHRSNKWYKNYAKYTIYNASKETINRILYESVGLIHEFGYEEQSNGIGNIFVGNVKSAWVEVDRKKGETKTFVICQSTRGAEYQLVKVPISLSFKKGDNVYNVAKSISDFSAMPLHGALSLKEIELDDDFNFDGSVKQAIETINGMLKNNACEIYFDNNMMCLLDYSEGGAFSEESYQTFNEVLLDYSSGLISASPVKKADDYFIKDVEKNLPYYFYGGKYNGKDIEYKSVGEESDKRKKIKFTSYINAGIMPNYYVNIDNTNSGLPIPNVKGRFLVRSLVINGNNYGGECKMEGEAIE